MALGCLCENLWREVQTYERSLKMGSMSLIHWLVVFGIALLLFGNRLPTIGKSLGSGIRNFKAGLNGEDDEAPAPKSEAERKHLPQSNNTAEQNDRQSTRQSGG
jgi:sec-independent protein translocase protein TatA